MSEVPSDHTKPLPEHGVALYLTYLMLPIMRHDEDNPTEIRVVPMIQSRN